MNTRFHLAFPVKDLEQTKIFYLNILGCSLGRESLKWVDFNLFGHQIVAHLSPEDCGSINRNQVDGDKIPARHFGVILNWDMSAKGGHVNTCGCSLCVVCTCGHV